ncbi:hypothetical protein [Marinobacter sp.]
MDALFKSPEQAWHDAYAGIVVNRSQLEPVIRSTTKDDFQAIYQAELSKVKKVIEALPKSAYQVGMYVFAPEGQVDHKTKNNVESLVWSLFVKDFGQDFVLSMTETTRAIILCRHSVIEARHRLLTRGQERRFTQRELGSFLAISHTSYARKWEAMFEKMVDIMVDIGRDAITPVSQKVEEINREYRKAA